MSDERSSDPPKHISLAQLDLAKGLWRGMWFYQVAAMRERYGAAYGRPVHREKRDDPK